VEQQVFTLNNAGSLKTAINDERSIDYQTLKISSNYATHIFRFLTRRGVAILLACPFKKEGKCAEIPISLPEIILVVRATTCFTLI